MKYDITKPVRPKMPKLGKGLESVNLLLSQVSKLMHEPLAPTVFPPLGAHVNGCELMYPSGIWMEPCGLIAHLCAEFSGNKGQIGLLAEAICRDFRTHDEESDKKLKDWDKAYKWSNQKDRPPHPDVAFFPPADCTPAGFNKNVEVLAEQGGKCMYMNLPEVVMANDICGGQFSDEFYGRLDGYLQRLTSAKGRFIIKPLNKLIDKMAEDMAELADCMDESWLYAFYGSWR